jgi:hypothetical protein
MSDLENQARPVLESAVTRNGVPYVMSPRHQEVAARWALKTCLVFQASQAPEPIAPKEYFDRLEHRAELPPQASIWIGSHARAREDQINSVFLQRPLTLESVEGHFETTPDFGFVNFLALGGVSFLVIGHRYRDHVEITVEDPLVDGLIKIAPPSGEDIAFPPQLMMDQAFIELLFDPGIEPPVLHVSVSPAP